MTDAMRCVVLSWFASYWMTQSCFWQARIARTGFRGRKWHLLVRFCILCGCTHTHFVCRSVWHAELLTDLVYTCVIVLYVIYWKLDFCCRLNNSLPLHLNQNIMPLIGDFASVWFLNQWFSHIYIWSPPVMFRFEQWISLKNWPLEWCLVRNIIFVCFSYV